MLIFLTKMTRMVAKTMRNQERGMDIDIVPMPQEQSITDLRAKLHAKIDSIRAKKRGWGGQDGGWRGGAVGLQGGIAGAGNKDELLEERRVQRAAMRERRRRKETKEKIKREEEKKGKKSGKDKDAKERAKVQGAPTKVRFACFSLYSQSCSSYLGGN